MHPYRDAAPVREPAASPGAEEWIIGALLAMLGVARVVIAIARGECAEADVTIVGILGVVGLVMMGHLVVRSMRRSA